MEEKNFLQCKARSQNLNPPADLRLLDYVTPYDDNLMCPICRCPFVDPVVLTECDHCFCRDCIRQTWTTSTAYNPLGPRGDCPSCRTPAKLGPRSATSKILTNILDDLIVKCPKSDDGCKAQVKRGEVQDHLSIYCGYALIECVAEGCELPVRRKDSTQGCLHFGVSCLACHEEMQKCHLETHWRSRCPDRKITCEACKNKVYYRDLAEHNLDLCSSISIPCPGAAIGCSVRTKRKEVQIHARSCTFAKLAPVLAAQTERLDEQESAQKDMARKLDVLEKGFTTMQSILFPHQDDPDSTSADPSSIPLLEGHGGVQPDGNIVITPSDEFAEAQLLPADQSPPTRQSRSRTSTTDRLSNSSIPQSAIPDPPGPRPSDLPEPFSLDFDLASPFPPPPNTTGPYASPLHHLLSMHEALREEMSRVNSALQELDGRHSMQILNENMRTREEITYMGAQVAGLSRQVHWLTSVQLQRQQSRSGTPGGGAGSGEVAAAAGPSVEQAISSAVRGAARIVSAGREGMAMRRGHSEEGRTKL
ncbi:hypothetical protein M409DRAFT_27048 [Zasmidium cellare ATCC 36951]|uniref:RING-type domain-containing protein n=1 Tax=Zasmidium cellare ATCC 36951 TaxID=1080233 RepID=A0A6A6C6B6_ZASCE|nr:uncharacterized protein M409DRAFT_27048 [Zasmidium cellare ATCC 36951]KAF2162423.1 hypothetical protein M409DRAFT_27048 [Zasmidium cellare ATCC 36951]